MSDEPEFRANPPHTYPPEGEDVPVAVGSYDPDDAFDASDEPDEEEEAEEADEE